MTHPMGCVSPPLCGVFRCLKRTFDEVVQAANLRSTAALVWLRAVAAPRSEKDHPGFEVVRERLEGVRDACRDKQEVARSERHPFGTAAEHAGAGRNDVDFVLLVRLLRIHLARGEQFNRKVASFEQHDERFRHPGQTLACV